LPLAILKSRSRRTIAGLGERNNIQWWATKCVPIAPQSFFDAFSQLSPGISIVLIGDTAAGGTATK